MPQAEFAKWINPLLRALRELGGSARPREAVERVASNEAVPDSTLDQTNPSGGGRFSNQVHWARFYLAEAGYIDRTKRGVWKLSELGNTTGRLSDPEIDRLVADIQAKAREGGTLSPGGRGASVPPPLAQGTARTTSLPAAEADEPAPDTEAEDYRERLMGVLRSLSPEGFERLCQRLLREAGFEQVTVTGRSGDGGIDGHGVLSLNAFVSFRVLFQCKRYQGSVPPDKVRDFRGAMQGRADKGIIMTTGTFSTEARREAGRDGAPPIELIDGSQLVELFANLELGLIPVKTFEVDERFFDEYR